MSNNKKVDIQKNTWISVQEEAQSEKKSMGRKLRLIENFSQLHKQGILKIEDYMPKGSNKQFFDLFKENKTITNSIQLAFLERVIVKSLGKNTDDFKEKYPLEFNVLREITPSVIMVIKEDCLKYDENNQCFTQPKNPNKPLEVNLKKDLFSKNNLLEDKFKTDGKDIWVNFRTTVDGAASLKNIADFYLKDRNEQKTIISDSAEKTATDTPINLAVERAVNSAKANTVLSTGNPTVMNKEVNGIKTLLMTHIDNLASSGEESAYKVIVELQSYITSVIYENDAIAQFYNNITKKYKVDMDLRPHHKGKPVELKQGKLIQYIQSYNS
tara:strand:- start:177 stop:1157 length:981 start_codon:yes stop_codon:yes gene_type:complete